MEFSKHFVAICLGICSGLWLANTGCERNYYVKKYQEKATLRCKQTHTAEQCRVLYTPSCQPSNGGGQNGCHN